MLSVSQWFVYQNENSQWIMVLALLSSVALQEQKLKHKNCTSYSYYSSSEWEQFFICNVIWWIQL